MATAVERDLREQQLGIFFVMPRVVRRVLQSELDIASPWQPPPHRKCCVIPRDRLLWLVARDELGVDSHAQLPEHLILIAQPEEDQLATMTRQELQRHYWRLMFHARIDFVMAMRTRPDQLSAAELRKRIDELGQTAFDEIRSVLRAEQMLMRPDNDRNVYAEFVAVYQELRAFAPDLLPLYFPSLTSSDEVLKVIGPECDTAELLNSTRPTDLAADEISAVEAASSTAIPVYQPEVIAEPRRSERQYRSLQRRADRLSATSNNVRAALLRLAAVNVAPAESTDAAQASLKDEIRKLVDRLQSALELSDHAAHPWLTMCEKLLQNAQRGFWNSNARLLYDLQKVCFDHEHEIYKVDLLRWSLSLGKTPLQRPLPNQRVVLMSKHLRGATLRVPQIEIDADGRRELRELLHEAADAAEQILRVRLNPLIEKALLDAGFVPASVVERIALKKLVHELADGVVNRGFITLGDLRDAISRNQLKMPDLTDAKEFFAGDPLLRADLLMSASLDGVYPRGPLYLRWLQKANSIAFGLPWGRLLTRYVALPFGLAFMILKALDAAIEHIPFLNPHKATSDDGPIAQAVADALSPANVVHASAATSHRHPVHVDILYSHEAMFLLGCVIFALIHFPIFRRRVIWFLTTTWSLLRIVFLETPRWILRWPLVDWFFKSIPMMLFRRFVLAPMLAAAIVWLLFPQLGLLPLMNRWWGLAIFVASFLLLNSRVGRDTEELAREFFGRTWYRIRVHLLMGIVTLVIDIFHTLMDGLERVLYAVDEWLRFRSGESKLTLGIKAVVGLVWSFIHGVIRFVVTLLLEPQVNPIKHFPVVTVSHKIVITLLTAPIDGFMLQVFDKPAVARLATGAILTSIPGVFGFLAWELKENWKLYKANRPRNLKPVPIGDHGETLLRLLCPGFHSGTIPRLFAKQRRAARKNTGSVIINKQAKFAERLHHESTALQHFIERELLALLHLSRTYRNFQMRVTHVDLTTNRVLVDIDEASHPGRPIQLEFAEQSGWLVGVTRSSGWLEDLEPEDVAIFKAAITGLFKLASVDLVREQIERQLIPLSTNSNGHPLAHHPYDISQAGLIVWPNGHYDTEVHYPLDEHPVSHPRPRALARSAQLNPLPTAAFVFDSHEVAWDDWRKFWDNEQNLPAHSTSKFRFSW